MANFEIPENPEYSEEVRKFEEEDPGHADLFNAVVETLLGNEVFLKKLADSLAKRISGLDTLTKYTTVQTPNPSIGAQIVQKESETFDLDGNALPFPIQEVVAGHEKAISQLNTDTKLTLRTCNQIQGLRLISFEATADADGNGKERYLRYCPMCASEDRKRFGESYWHRLHQLQGMNCCNIHKCRLIDSSVIISGKDSPKLVTAEEMIPSESGIEIADNVKKIRLADYMARVFQADMDMESEVTIGAYLHSKMPVNKYRSVRGEQRNMALFHSDFMEYCKELEQNHFTEIWQIQKVLTDQRANFDEICMIAMFLEIPVEELVKPALPEISDEEAFDERVKELRNQGLKYPEIAELLGASYNVVKPVGEKRYGSKTSKKHNKGGRNKQDWSSIDIQTLPKVTAAIKNLQGSRTERPKKITIYAVARQMNVHSKYFDNLPLCKQEILEHYESQEEYWAREVVWAVKKILSEGQPLNWKHIRNLTNMRNENFQACKPYLEMYVDDEMTKRIKELL